MMRPDNGDPLEVELKLILSDGARAALEQHPLFQQASAEQRNEMTVYFDTAELGLLNGGAALRIRRRGERRIQTLKMAGDPASMAAARGEWEWNVEGDEPDLHLLADTPLDSELLRTLDGNLHPVFATDITRTIRLLRLPDGAQVEAALDEGRVVSGDADEPVSELELELKGGHVGALYRLALELQETVGLAISPESKATRGYRLLTGSPPPAGKASAPILPPEVEGYRAVRLVLGGPLAHVVANIGSSLRGEAEGTHQIRVALRRLRAALRLLSGHLDPDAVRGFDKSLRQFGRILGETRDWDVFVLSTLPAFTHAHRPADWLDALAAIAEDRRAQANARSAEALRGRAFTSLLLSIAAWLEEGVLDPSYLGDDALRGPVADMAAEMLDAAHKVVSKRGRRIKTRSEHELHSLRKAMKRLRYNAESLSSLYKRKPFRAYAKHCEKLQEILGEMNDARVTIGLIDSLAKDGHAALMREAEPLRKQSRTLAAKMMRKLESAWDEFHDADPFWR